MAVERADQNKIQDEPQDEFERSGEPLPSHWISAWRSARALVEYHQFNERLTKTDKQRLDVAGKKLLALIPELPEKDKTRLWLLVDLLLDIYFHFSSNPIYAPVLGDLYTVRAELAFHQRNNYATHENSPATIWNTAVSNAAQYKRRAGDEAGAKKVVELARTHPHAATKYDILSQTPIIYHPGLTAKPFWPASSWELARRLEDAFAEHTLRSEIDRELDYIIANQGLERLRSPVLPLDPGKPDAEKHWGGAWSEAVLYTGSRWKRQLCAAMPTITELLRGSQSAFNEICSGPSRGNLCGPVAISILRLAPGATILAHNGVTNRRLILHFALRGSEGVTIAVGGERREFGGDGHALVFDDSFEHSVHHQGREDRYILFAQLKHPDVSEETYQDLR